ncbi:hypothetical protein ACCO45_003404 [Purpureocillium lilacinum]|uniref:Uncharacterized protein n=1 Tax=Purpureocillium lilacinum TaxID=33203 RepID=A0ACC4E062_PURLI
MSCAAAASHHQVSLPIESPEKTTGGAGESCIAATSITGSNDVDARASWSSQRSPVSRAAASCRCALDILEKGFESPARAQSHSLDPADPSRSVCAASEHASTQGPGFWLGFPTTAISEPAIPDMHL